MIPPNSRIDLKLLFKILFNPIGVLLVRRNEIIKIIEKYRWRFRCYLHFPDMATTTPGTPDQSEEKDKNRKPKGRNELLVE